MESFAEHDKSKPFIANNSVAKDRGYIDDLATATCLCGAVQLAFVCSLRHQQTPGLTCNLCQPTEGEGLVNSFVCNCVDCRKLTASTFASNFAIASTHLKHIRGQSNLKTWTNTVTPIRPNTSMTDHFCNTCGTLMYRVSSAFPEVPILRLGSVDDLSLVEGKLKPQWEQFVKDRVGWCKGVGIEGIRTLQGNSDTYVLETMDVD